MYEYGAHRSDAEAKIAEVPVVLVEGSVALCDGGEEGRDGGMRGVVAVRNVPGTAFLIAATMMLHISSTGVHLLVNYDWALLVSHDNSNNKTAVPIHVV